MWVTNRTLKTPDVWSLNSDVTMKFLVIRVVVFFFTNVYNFNIALLHNKTEINKSLKPF